MGRFDTQLLPLPREEVVKAVERKDPIRIPLVMAKWWGEGLQEQYGGRLKEFDRIPEDTVMLMISMLDVESMGLSWTVASGGAKDSDCIIDDWAKLDEFIEKMPDPENDEQFNTMIEKAEEVRSQGIYLLFGWWRLFFERPWGIRGMENILADYYTEPDNVHRLHNALADLYCRYLKRAVRDIKPDGFWTSDDLGHQTQLMMSPGVFREFIKPYYARVGEVVKENGIHWWLHSCGNNTEVLGDLADTGVNVFHPVQKGAMDEVTVAQEFGDRLTFLAGIDVQHTLQEKTPEEVRTEVRFIINTL